MRNWKEIVESCDLKNWREALAAVLTYAKPDEFSALCGKKMNFKVMALNMAWHIVNRNNKQLFRISQVPKIVKAYLNIFPILMTLFPYLLLFLIILF